VAPHSRARSDDAPALVLDQRHDLRKLCVSRNRIALGTHGHDVASYPRIVAVGVFGRARLPVLDQLFEVTVVGEWNLCVLGNWL
jgi:hypothetical protein